MPASIRGTLFIRIAAMTPASGPRPLNLFLHAAVSSSAAHRVRRQAQPLANPTLLALVRVLVPFIAMPSQHSAHNPASEARFWDDLLAAANPTSSFVPSTPGAGGADGTADSEGTPRATLITACDCAQQLLLGSLTSTSAVDDPDADIQQS